MVGRKKKFIYKHSLRSQNNKTIFKILVNIYVTYVLVPIFFYFLFFLIMFGYLFLIKLSTFYHINFFTSLFLRISHLYNPIYRVARMVEGGGGLWRGEGC